MIAIRRRASAVCLVCGCPYNAPYMRLANDGVKIGEQCVAQVHDDQTLPTPAQEAFRAVAIERFRAAGMQRNRGAAVTPDEWDRGIRP